ncbi:MAG: polysaccharide deacetylase family protein, partial [Firmicutes bacterium]|nr:polysaccharide deacetylase family protein [Bacillota bacterium]
MQKCKKGAKLLVLFLVFTLVVGMVPQIPVNAEAGESTLQLYESGQYLPVLLNEDFSDYALGNFIFDGATWRSSNHSTHGTNRNLDPQVVAAPNRTGQALRVVRQSLIMDRLIPNLPTTGILEIQYDIFVPRPVPTSGDLANVGIGLLRDTSPGVGQFASVVWNTYSSSRQNMGPRVPGGGGDPNHPPEQDSNMFNVLPHQGPGGGTPDHYVRNWPTACGRFEAMWRLGDWATLLMVHDLDTGVIRYYLNGEDITPIPGYGNQRTRTITGDGRNFSGVRINSEGPAANGSGAAYITNLVVRGIPREPDATGEIGDTEVARWRNNLVAAFAITADDSSHCHLDYVVPMLDEVGMLGTFFVNPGMGGPGTIGERGHVGNNGFWSFTYRTDEWQAVADRGHELGNHTMHHRGSTDREDAIWQIEETSRILREMQPNATVLPFLAGGGTTWLGVTVAERNQIAWNDNLLTGILVSGAQNPGGTPLTAAETRELDVFYIHGGVWGTGNNRGFTPAQMRGHVQTTINSGGFRWIRLHEVIGPPNPPTTKTVASVDMSVSTYSLQALVDALTVESNRVWVDTVSAIHKYMMTRNNAEITVLNASDTEITIGLTATDREQSVITNNPVVLGPLPQRGTFEELYNESITLLTTVPESWQYAYVTQDGTVQHIRISDGIAMYDAYPNKGDIVLTPSTTSPANYVVSIAVTSQPSNLVYDEGDQVDLSGAAVRLTFANGDTQTVAFEDFEDNGIVARPAHGTELARYHHGGPVTIRHAETNHAAATNNLTVYYEDDGNGNGNGNGAPYEILPITSLEYVFEVEGVTPTDGDNFTLQVVGNTWPYRLPTIPAQNGTQRINIGFGAGINWIINLGRVVRVLNPAFNADGTVNYPLSGPPLSGSTATLTASQIIVNGDIEMTFANTHILRLNADLGQWTDRYFPNVWNTPVAGTVIASTADGTTRLVMQDGIANDSGTG